jgi:hypothetical protein
MNELSICVYIFAYILATYMTSAHRMFQQRPQQQVILHMSTDNADRMLVKPFRLNLRFVKGGRGVQVSARDFLFIILQV